MKNDDEMYRSVLSRREEYRKNKEKRIRTIRRTVPVLACFCFIVVFIPMLWGDFAKLPDIQIQPNTVDEPTIESSESAAVSTTISTQKPETDMIVTTKKKQTQTVITTAVSDRRSYRETKQETAEHRETQPPVTDAPIIETQTTAPKQTTVETSVTTVDFSDSDLLIGYDDGNHHWEENQKPDWGEFQKPAPSLAPSSSKRIVMRCKSFCAPGKKLLVDVAMADGSLRPIDYDTVEKYEYSIYTSEGYSYENYFTNNKVEDENIIINGEQGEYKKEYSREEINLFDINGEYYDYDSYHHETAEIDFSRYEADSSGCITFSFSAVYDEESNSESNRLLYFYVGEKGTAVSNIGVEKAKEGYQAACDLPERG